MSATNRITTLTLQQAHTLVNNLLKDFSLDSNKMTLEETERMLTAVRTVSSFEELQHLEDLLAVSLINKKTSNKTLSIALIHTC